MANDLGFLKVWANANQSKKTTKRSLSEFLNEPEYELSFEDGTNLGKVGFKAYQAIKENRLDSYTPYNDEEKRVIDSFKAYNDELLKKDEDEKKQQIIDNNPVLKKYNIDPFNFNYPELEEWAKKHNHEIQFDSTGGVKLKPKKEGGFLGFGGNSTATKEEEEDAKVLTQLLSTNFVRNLSQTDIGATMSGAYGVMDGASFGLFGKLGDYGTKRQFDKSGLPEELYVKPTQAWEKTLSEHSVANLGGNIAGSLLSTVGVGKIVRAGTAKVFPKLASLGGKTTTALVQGTQAGAKATSATRKVLSNMGKWISKSPVAQEMINDGITFSIVSSAREAGHGGSAEDIFQAGIIGLASGGISGGVEAKLGQIGLKFLFDKKLQHKVLPEIARVSLSNAVGGTAYNVTSYTLSPADKKPTTEDMVRDFAVDLAFGAIFSAKGTIDASKASKADIDNLYNKMEQDFKALSEINMAKSPDVKGMKQLAQNVIDYADTMQKLLKGEAVKTKIDGEDVDIVMTDYRFIGQNDYVKSMIDDLDTIKGRAKDFLDLNSETATSTKFNDSNLETSTNKATVKTPVATETPATAPIVEQTTPVSTEQRNTFTDELDEIASTEMPTVGVGETFVESGSNKIIKVIDRGDTRATVEITTPSGAKETKQLRLAAVDNMAVDDKYTKVEYSVKTKNASTASESPTVNETISPTKTNATETEISIVENENTTTLSTPKPIHLTRVGNNYDIYGEDAVVFADALGVETKKEMINDIEIDVLRLPADIAEAFADAISEEYNLIMSDKVTTETNTETKSRVETPARTVVSAPKNITLNKIGSSYAVYGNDAVELANNLNLVIDKKVVNGVETDVLYLTENLVNNISKDHGDKYNFVTTTEAKNQPATGKTASSDKDVNSNEIDATEVENPANVLQTQQERDTIKSKTEDSSVESEENSNEQGRADLLYDNGKRANNGGSQKQTERLLSFRRRNQGKDARERANFARELIERGQTEEVIDENTKYNLVKPEHYNDDMLSMIEDAKRRGVELHFFVGRMEVEVELDDGTKVTKLMSGLALPSSQVAYVQYDDAVESPQQIYKHELCHTKWYSPEMQEIKNSILNSLSEAERQKIKQTQRFKDYMTAYKNKERICWEEFVCDVMSGKTQYTANFIDTAYDYWYGNESIDSYNPADYTTSTDAGDTNKSNKRWNIAEKGNVEDEKTRDNRKRTERLPEEFGNQRRRNSGNSENLSNGNPTGEIQSSGGKVDGEERRTTQGSSMESVEVVASTSDSAFSHGRTRTDGERFLVALRDGDEETARILLNGQAVKNGFVPANMYHGTQSDNVFTQFNTEAGIYWVTPNLDYADGYADGYYGDDIKAEQLFTEPDSGVYDLYIKPGKVLDVGNINLNYDNLDVIDDFRRRVGLSHEEYNRCWSEGKKHEYRQLWTVVHTSSFAKIARERGYDSIRATERDGVQTYGCLYPENLKSAKLETFDDNGNLIPLEERFNEDNKDIRYNISAEQETEYLELAKEPEKNEKRLSEMVNEVAKANGYNIKAYHGTARADRVGTVFRPDRATSGPMAYFTDSKEIASNYARDKADTSLAYDEEYDSYYTQFRVNRGGKSISVPELWKYLSISQKNKIKELAGHIKFDDDYENIIVDKSAEHGNGAYDAYTLNMHRGNVLEALVDTWLETGDLYNREADFLEVLRLVGIEDAEYRDPDARQEKVYDTWLKIKNPFDTDFADRNFYDSLSNWIESHDMSVYEKETSNADMWDKNNQTPETWLEKLNYDIENSTTHAWTVIPDFVTDYLKEQHFDGIKDKGGKGGGDGHTVWIPFSSEQIKSAEPVTYDNNGDIIPLSERFNPEKDDIRWNLSGEDADIKTQKQIESIAQEISSHEELIATAKKNTQEFIGKIKENKSLQKRLHNAKRQMLLSPTPIVNATKAGKVTKEILKEMNSTLKASDLRDEVMSIYNEYFASIKKAGGVESKTQEANENMMRRFAELAVDIADSSEVFIESDDYIMIKSYVKNTRIKVPDWSKSDVDYAAFRKSHMGTLNLTNDGLDIDVAYAELCELFPGMFDAELHSPSDQLFEIANTIEKLKPYAYNPNTSFMQEAIDHIVYRFVSEADGLAAAPKTKAQKIAEKGAYDKEVALEKEREAFERKLEKQKKDSETLIRNLQKKIDDAKYVRYWEKRLDKEEKAQAIKELRERRDVAVLKSRIRSIVSDMKKNLDKSEKAGGYPKELVKVTAEICSVLDFHTGKTKKDGTPTKVSLKLDALKMQYDALKNNENYDFKSEHSEELSGKIGELHNLIKDKRVTELNVYELSQLKDILSEISHRLSNARKQIGLEKSRENAIIGAEIINSLNSNDDVIEFNKRQILREMRLWSQKGKAFILNPHRINEMIAGYDKNSAWWNLYDAINRGSRKASKFVMEANKPFDELIDGGGNEIAFYDFRTKKIKTGIKYIDGSEVEVPKSIICELVMVWERKQGRTHLEADGAKIPDMELYNKGKTTTAITDGGRRTMPITPMDIARLKQMLDSYDLEWIDKARHLFNKTTKDAINETSMELLGRELAKSENYIRLYVDKDFIRREIDGNQYDSTLESHGSLKETTPNAKQPVILRGLHENVYDQIDFAAKYYGLAIPIRNFNKVYNTVINNDGERHSVRETIGKKFGSNIQLNVLEQLIKDLQSPRKSSIEPFGKIRGNWLGATFWGNIRSTLKQTTSYWTASAIIGEDSLVKGLAQYARNSKQTKAEINKYSGTLYKRSQGLSTTELGDRANAKRLAGASNKVTKVINQYAPALRNIPKWIRPGNWLQSMDCSVASALWEACKIEALKTMNASDDGYMKFVTDLYERVIEETQSNYDVTHRPEALKNTNTIVRTITMFQTDNLQQTGIIYSAFNDYKTKADAYKADASGDNKIAIDEAKDRLSKAIRSRVYSSLWLVFATMLGDMLLRKFKPYVDDEEKDITSRSIIKQLMQNVCDDMFSVFVPVAGQLITSAMDTWSKGYDFVTEPSFEAIQEFIEATSKIWDSASDGRWEDTKESVADAIPAISNFTGIPMKNITELFNAAKGYAGDIKEGDFAHDISNYASSKSFYSYDDLASCIISGDAEKEKKITDYYSASDKEVEKSAITKAIKPAYVQMYIDSPEKAYNVKRKLILDYDYTEDSIDEWTIKEYLRHIVPNKKYSDGVVSNPEYAAEIKSAVEKNVAWSSKSVQKTVKSHYKQIYKDGNEKDTKALRDALLKDGGFFEVTISTWEREADNEIKKAQNKANVEKKKFK